MSDCFSLYRGGYTHPTHPFRRSQEALPEEDSLSSHILDTYTSAVALLRSPTEPSTDTTTTATSSGSSSESSKKRARKEPHKIGAADAVYLRLDRLEEKMGEKLDAIGVLQLPHIPVVAIFEGRSADCSVFLFLRLIPTKPILK